MLIRIARAPLLAAAAAALLLLSACATTNAGGEPLSPAQQQLRSQTERFNETVATGAVVGALALGILGALLAGPRNRGEGAALGALAGAAIGGASGYYIATRNERLSLIHISEPTRH